eukprot:GEMP01028988.1.p1 GENE.GEMP01028988.1~~GEMP01028988.1.p1  ORF type:complete len:371 (+),score=62.92 GEMP01028988.1:37-1149(+)
MVLIDFPTVLWAAGAALFFGVGNAIANILDGFPESEHVPFVMQSAVCLLVAGIVSIIQSGLSICLYQRGCTCSCIYNYKATEFENPETRRRSIIECVISGVFYSGALVLFRLSFKFAEYGEDVSPWLNAIVVFDLFIAAVICHFGFEERMTFLQWITLVVVCAGVVVMCVSDFLAKSDKVTGLYLKAISSAVAASSFFLVSNISIKNAYAHDISVASLNYLRMLAVISSGCISVLVATLVDEKPFPHNWQVWSLMAGSGALYGVGIVCLNYALWPHCTAMALSIVTGGSSVVSVVSFVIAERTAMPPIVKLAGISLVALAIVSIVVMMCVSACQQEPDDDADDADEFGKHGRVVLGSAESLRVDRAITFH